MSDSEFFRKYLDILNESEQSVTESHAGFNSDEVRRGLEGVATDMEDEDPSAASGLQQLANRIYQSYPDSVSIADIMGMLNEPDMRSLSKDDVEYALQATGIMDFMEDKQSDNKDL